ncbi:MAG: hypothetical protein AAFS10_11210 [Myxococcota bacterium]
MLGSSAPYPVSLHRPLYTSTSDPVPQGSWYDSSASYLVSLHGPFHTYNDGVDHSDMFWHNPVVEQSGTDVFGAEAGDARPPFCLSSFRRSQLEGPGRMRHLQAKRPALVHDPGEGQRPFYFLMP